VIFKTKTLDKGLIFAMLYGGREAANDFIRIFITEMAGPCKRLNSIPKGESNEQTV
jgi:hypothetical protein